MPNDFSTEYSELNDDELLRLACDRDSLIKEAQSSLDAELRRRNLSESDRVEQLPAIKRHVDAERIERLKDWCVRILFFVWVILLVPWLVIAPLSGMALDGGYTIDAIGFIFAVWTYPIAVFGAFKLLDRSRNGVLLPLVNVVGIPVCSAVLEWLRRRLA